MSEPFLKVTSDFTREFNDIIKSFKSDKVLIGIPAATSARKPSEEEEPGITNAALLALNNFGSPAMNIPARPVMEIGMRNAQEAIGEEYGKALKLVLKKGVSAIDQYYGRAGMIAANSIKKAIDDQDGFPGPSELTLALRKARGFKGTKSLLVTGQLRNAITYVIQRKGGL